MESRLYLALWVGCAWSAGAWLTVVAASASPLSVNRLRCESEENPVAVQRAQPELGWWLDSPERGQRQTAYQVQVASAPALLDQDRPDRWDSGRVQSAASVQVAYAGRALRSEERVCWRVRVWDKDGEVSGWSAPATWTMGLLGEEAWRAHWIGAEAADGPLPLFRREFVVTKPVRRALAHICGLGFYELRLNGRKVGDHELDPGWTNYRKRCLYATYDVTGQIARGTNALGVMLGNGMYNVRGGRYTKFTGSFGPPKLILQLQLEFDDGSSQEVASDATWKTAPGPITFSCIYGGEDYDARRALADWDAVGFDDHAWQPVRTVDGPGGKLAAQTAPPIRVMRTFPTVRVTEPKPGVFVHDLGQNFSGWPCLKVRGPAGKTIKLITGELLGPDGQVSQGSSGSPVWFSYTLKGDGVEVWHPRFSYSGFRYVQVEGATRDASAADTPLLLELEGQFVHSSAPVVGEFACSNPLINRIHALIDRAIESNLQSVLTDCPHREKLGWLEVSHLLGPALLFNYDAARLYRKICDDMAESQLAEGLVPDIAPEYTVFGGGFRDSPEWGSASVIDPWLLYCLSGDVRVLTEHYDVMQRYAAYLGTKASNHLVAHGLGDWYDIGPRGPGESQLTSRGVTATAIYYQDLCALQQTAALLGKSRDAERYATLAADVRAAFNQAFFHPETGSYDRGSQTAQAMPLVLGLVADTNRARVLASLVDNVRTNGNRVTAGDVGFAYVVRALYEGGRGDVLFDLVTQTNGPGYADQLRRGATSLTEAWDANPASSQNHCMLGHAEEWFYRGLAGINPDPATPGFKHFVIRPDVVGDVTWVKAHYDSVHGRVVSEWQRENGRLRLRVTVPANTTATLFLPTKDAAAIRESDAPLNSATGVRVLRTEDGRAVLALDSGQFDFATPADP